MKKIYLYLIIFLAIFGFVGFFLYNRAQKPTIDESEIFVITAPEEFDEYKRQRLDEKIEQAKKEYEANPTDNWTWVIIATVYEFAHDYDRAIAAYEKAMELEPDDAVAPLNLGAIYESQGNFEQAEKYYIMAVERNPVQLNTHLSLFELYKNKIKSPEKAEKTLQTGLSATGQHIDLLKIAVKFYKDRGDMEKSNEYQTLLTNKAR